MFSDAQENAIVDIVVVNNAIKLREIQDRVLADNDIFENVNSVSTTTIARVLKKHQVTMKQLYTVPFERNSERVKEQRYQYVQVRRLRLRTQLYKIFTVKKNTSISTVKLCTYCFSESNGGGSTGKTTFICIYR